VRACEQCGLSIGDTATFCPVCGARCAPLPVAKDEPAPAGESEPAEWDPRVGFAGSWGPEAGADPTPVPGLAARPWSESGWRPEEDSQVDAGPEPEQTQPGSGEQPPAEPWPAPADEPRPAEDTEFTPGQSLRWSAGSESAPETESAPVAEAQAEAEAVVEPEPEAEPDAEPEPEAEAEPGVEPEPEVEAELAPEPEVEPASVEQRLATLSAVLHDAAGLESTEPARAADLYRDAIVAALDVSDDPLDLPDARRHLLRGLDGLSLVLARQGLSEEALAVVDDAASLGLLEGGDDVGAVHRAALNARREELLRAILPDSAEA